MQFQGVSFRYAPDRPTVLAAVNLDVAQGEVIGIVGRSGSGKSTLSKLIQRMYTPESGRVLIDGVDLAMIDPSWLRRQVGVVLQDNVLFRRTVRENIALADPGMPMEQVVQAAKLAGAHEFILELPQAYEVTRWQIGAANCVFTMTLTAPLPLTAHHRDFFSNHLDSVVNEVRCVSR